MQDNTRFVTPVGRIVFGDLYDPQTKDFDGKPLVVKTGDKAGQPTVRYNIGLAVPKVPGKHWAELVGGDGNQFGARIWNEGHKAHPHAAPRPDFAWKVTDGDSTMPGKPRGGKPGRKPCDKEGFPGHWVFTFSGQQAPTVCNADGSAYILDKDAVVAGDYVQIAGSVAGNTGATPGVYLNYAAVALRDKGKRITSGPDIGALGFGAAALPAHREAPAAFTPPAAVAAAPAPAPATPAVAVQPSAGFIAAPAPAAVPAVAPAPPPAAPPAPLPPVASGPAMTAKAAGAPYAAFIAQGWTDDTLRANGYIV